MTTIFTISIIGVLVFAIIVLARLAKKYHKWAKHLFERSWGLELVIIGLLYADDVGEATRNHLLEVLSELQEIDNPLQGHN